MPAAAAKEAPAKESQVRQGITKIGIVDMQKILQESKAAKAAKASFMKEMEAKREKINTKTLEVQRLEQEIARLAPDASLETRRTKGDQLKAQARELNNLRQDVEEEIKRKDRDMAQRLFGEIMQIIRNYAKNERFSLILERGTIVAAEEGLDITDKILKIYDSQKK
jgi:outer membrane protein